LLDNRMAAIPRWMFLRANHGRVFLESYIKTLIYYIYII
jgi:hypothetical protein